MEDFFAHGFLGVFQSVADEFICFAVITRILSQDLLNGFFETEFVHGYDFWCSADCAGGCAVRYVFTAQPVRSKPKMRHKTNCSCLVKRLIGRSITGSTSINNHRITAGPSYPLISAPRDGSGKCASSNEG